MKRLIVDLDDTISFTTNGMYDDAIVNEPLVVKLFEYQQLGFEIVIHTSRNMRSLGGRIGKINVHTLPKIVEWLNRHGVAYDEIIVGKPWCGTEGFYVDDRAIRPSEFETLTYSEIRALLEIPE